MNTCNLTQISLRNDPINHQMHVFSFRVSKDEVWSSRWEFSFLFRLNYEFKNSNGVEMSQEQEETNGARIDALNTENLMNDHGQVLPPWRIALKEAKMGVAVGSNELITINDRDDTLFCKSSRLDSGRLIADQGSRCTLITWRRRCVDLIVRRILIERSWLNRRSVGWLNVDRYNSTIDGLDQLT